MKSFRLIFKGVLLYSTLFISALFLCGLDSIIESGLFTKYFAFVLFLILVCKISISKKELFKLIFYKDGCNR